MTSLLRFVCRFIVWPFGAPWQGRYVPPVLGLAILLMAPVVVVVEKVQNNTLAVTIDATVLLFMFWSAFFLAAFFQREYYPLPKYG